MAEQPPFKPGASYNTPLDPLSEMMFRGWVQKNNVPMNLGTLGPTDYDMRGYFQGLQSGHPMARLSEINPNDNRPHYPDYYKTPLHQTFSSDSQWAGPSAPQWIDGNKLASPSARILHDETQPSAGVSAIARLLMGR